MTAEDKEEDEAPKEGEEKTPAECESPTKVEEPPKDEEGLLLEYDAILCGTGLVQSILASALTRANKTVLHCDGNDHYGDLDTVWTFQYLKELCEKKGTVNDVTTGTTATTMQDSKNPNNSFISLSPQGSNQSLQFHSTSTKTEFPVTNIGTKVRTIYGEGTVIEKVLPSAEKEGKLVISLSNWTLANGKSPTVSIGVTLNKLHSTVQCQVSTEQTMEAYFQTSGEIQSQASLAAQKILTQQSRSLALDVTPALLYASGVGVQGLLTSNVAEHLEFQTMQGMYWLDAFNKLQRVPCSKGDVMQSSLLPPLDKRRFMKFFQSAMDYATERELAKESSVVESADDNNNNTEEGVLSLNERQLNQGRSLARPQNKAMAKKDLQTMYDCMETGMPFDTYLQEHAKLSPQLRQLIRHALALEITNSVVASDDENTTPTLSTHDGMGRLCDHLKALGRYGTTAFLTPLYGSGEMPQFFCRSAAVYGATYLLRREPKSIHTSTVDGKLVREVTVGASDGAFGPPVPEKQIKAKHVVVAQDAVVGGKSKQRLLRRISVLRGTLIPNELRSVIVIPPTTTHKYAIHGLLLDESAKVAPYGSSLLHLSTVVDPEGVATNTVLENAVQTIVGSAAGVDEIFHATFSYALQEETKETADGLHVIHRPAMSLVVDEALEQAKGIFTKICGPDLEFLALSEDMQTKLKEQLKDAYRGPNQSEDDTEQVVLDSAMEMLAT